MKSDTVVERTNCFGHLFITIFMRYYGRYYFVNNPIYSFLLAPDGIFSKVHSNKYTLK